MNTREITRMIRRLSRRRHRRLMTLAALKRYPSLNREEIAHYRACIAQLGQEIDTLLGKL